MADCRPARAESSACKTFLALLAVRRSREVLCMNATMIVLRITITSRVVIRDAALFGLRFTFSYPR
jgi:hypothetical protein